MAINFRRELFIIHLKYWRAHFFDYCRLKVIMLLAGNDVIVCNAWFDDYTILRTSNKCLIARSNIDILPKK